jgi:cob(I)alamin adenosyltransferase
MAIQQFPNVEVLRAKTCGKFTFQMNADEHTQTQKEHAKLLEQAFADLTGVRMLVLDECMAACTTGMIDETRLLELIQTKPPEVELVLTGRDPSKRLLATADYITEMKKHRHPYDSGIQARRGIER